MESDAAQQSNAAAGYDAFFDSRAGSVHGVFNASFLFLHFGLGCGADLDHGNAADQLGQALLQFLAVVVAGGLLDLAADFLHPAFDLLGLAVAFDDGGVVLVDGDLLGLAEIAHLHVLQLDAKVFGDGFAAGEVAMSCSMALRRSPKPGALTAQPAACRAAC